jgi:hypothetical protein
MIRSAHHLFAAGDGPEIFQGRNNVEGQQMRAPVLRRRAYARALVLAAVVVGVLVVSEGSAGAASLSVSSWQVFSNTSIFSNPDGNQIHGDPGEYGAAPAIPAQNDGGWANCGPGAPSRSSPYTTTRSLCPNASTIGMNVGSILPNCWSFVNFTYFQALVDIPAGTTISQFSVNMSGADDGARISLVNSAHPNGITPTNGFIGQVQGQATGNLASFVVAGEVNRVIITQVDDCAVGNDLGSAQVSLNGTVITPDTTAPVDAPVLSPAANANGWNNSDVNVAWHWTDAGSGVDPANCTQSSTSSGESATIQLNSTCKDLAGNSKSDFRKVKVDKTAPADAPSVSVSGHTATVTWHWSDGLSGVDAANCAQSTTLSGIGLVTIPSTCSDLAGNSSSDSVDVQFDDAPPVDSPSAVPAWSTSNVTVNWNWTDAGSGIDTANCTQSSTSAGEGAITLTSTCSDLAGNSASDSKVVHVDKTAPAAAPVATPAPNLVGWNNSDVTVAWNWTDGGSGIDAANCTQSSTSAGEGAITLTSTCSDIAGNSASRSVTVQVDKTAPTASPSAVPAWSTSDVSVNWNWTDGGSGIDAANCTQSSTSAGEGAITLTSTCSDVAGNSASDSVTVHVDKTAPAASPSAVSAWSNSDVTVAWNWTDGGSGIDVANCTQSSTSAGEGAITLTSTCSDVAGNSASDSVTVHVDKTVPTAAPVATPAPNGLGWNNSNVTVAWNWTDGGSGIDAANCTQSSTTSGDGSSITLTSNCSDNAGNSSSASATVKVDQTAPTVSYTGGGTYTVDQDVSIGCSSSDALSGVASDTCAGVSADAWSLGLGTHSLSATATDNAGNTGSGSTSYTVKVDATSLCNLVTRWAKNAGLANSLCVKLQAAAAAGARGQTKTHDNNIAAFDNEVSAQSGKGFTAAQAALLVQFAAAL